MKLQLNNRAGLSLLALLTGWSSLSVAVHAGLRGAGVAPGSDDTGPEPARALQQHFITNRIAVRHSRLRGAGVAPAIEDAGPAEPRDVLKQQAITNRSIAVDTWNECVDMTPTECESHMFITLHGENWNSRHGNGTGSA
jgi:hypothetical protein